MERKQARLILSDGSVFQGWSFGFERETVGDGVSYSDRFVGEVVFNTAMTGYPESLTDPSYAGQILVMTYPLVGNYGVPSLTPSPSLKGEGGGCNGVLPVLESERIHVKGLAVADYSEQYSHWNARESLAAWLKREKVPGITGIDTRRLTKVLREHGVMMGRIVFEGAAMASQQTEEGHGAVNHAAAQDYGEVNWVEKVSCTEVITYRPENNLAPLSSDHSPFKRVVLVDCGVKANIIRCLIKRGVEVVRVPWDYDFNQLDFDGLFLANGPGDPERCEVTIEHIRTFLHHKEVRPCMGICLGNQLLARAAGAKTYKLKYGHRSHNQPVREVGTNRCFITSQNHGYAVDDATLPADWEPLFVNMNDGSNEGIRHKTNPWFSAQFHPEACSGPTDTEYLFDEFVAMIERNAY